MAESLFLATGLATSGATGTLFTSAAASTAFSMLPSVGTVFGAAGTAASMFGQVSAGKQQAAIYNAQARQMELDARLEALRGKEKANLISKQLNRDLASANALFAARGTSNQSIIEAGMRSASEDINNTLFGTSLNVASMRTQAQQYAIEGSAKKSAGYTGALSTLTNSRLATNLMDRLGA